MALPNQQENRTRHVRLFSLHTAILASTGHERYPPGVEVRRTAPGQSWFAEDDLVLVHCATLVSEVTVRALVSYSARRTARPKLAIIYVLEGTVLGVPEKLAAPLS